MMFAAACLWVAVRNIAPIELVAFRNNCGMPVFEIVKEKCQAKEFEDFVALLVNTIVATAYDPK